MAGLGTLLAGAAVGFGDGIVAQAEQRREDALMKLKRDWQKEDQATQRSWDVEDREVSYSRGLAEEQRGYAREDGKISQRAGDLASVFGTGDGGEAPDPERALYVAQRLETLGYPKHVAAGLVGNLMQESGAGLDTGAVGDGGHSVGMGQWNKSRGRALVAFAEERGKSPQDLDTQIDFLDWEMKNTEKDAYDAIMKATTAEEAAQIASEKFWRPSHPAIKNRQRNASSVFRLLADPDTPAPVREALLGPKGLGVTTDATSKTTAKPVNLSASLSTYLQRRFIDRRSGEPDFDIVNALEREILRLMESDENLSETKARQMVIDAMEYEQPTKTEGGTWRPFDGEERQVPTGDKVFTGGFVYNDGTPPPAATPKRGLGAGTPEEERVTSAPETPPETSSEIPPEQHAAVLKQAKDAIAKGKDRDAVIARLVEMGIDPKGI